MMPFITSPALAAIPWWQVRPALRRAQRRLDEATYQRLLERLAGDPIRDRAGRQALAIAIAPGFTARRRNALVDRLLAGSKEAR